MDGAQQQPTRTIPAGRFAPNDDTQVLTSEIPKADAVKAATSSSETAAGVMPEMRAAWPKVSGRC